MSAAHEVQTATPIDNRKFAMWTLIASECFLFGSLITTYMIYRFETFGGPHPRDVYAIDLTTISTFVLLMSSVAMVLALHYCKHRQLRQMQLWLGVVVLFGASFLGFQAYEFQHFVRDLDLGLSTSPFSSSFFVLTGFHGAHVFVGVLWMFSILVTSLRRGNSWFDEGLVEVAGLYWHFVDVVWIIIFTVVYLLVYV